jgi:hypothetical protein
VSTLSDPDSEATLTVSDPMSVDGDLPKLDSLSPSEEQAVRALEDLRAGNTLNGVNMGSNHRHNVISAAESARFFQPSTELFHREFCCESMGSRQEL